MTDPNAAEDQRRQLRASFESMLQDQPDLNAEDRSFLMKHFDDALEQQDLSAPVELDPDSLRRDWAEAVDALVPEASASERDVHLRRFDETLEPLRRDSVKDAYEYARRRREQGEQAALEWLNERNAERRAAQAASVPAPAQPAARKPAPRNPWGG